MYTVSLYWNKNRDHMVLHNGDERKKILCSCDVRNELNGRRPRAWKEPADEVVYSYTERNTRTNIPVMPRDFPEGKWHITGIDVRTDPYRRPFIIMTDAWQWLDVWKLDEDGGYDKPAGHRVKDYQYGLHCSTSNTTTGCQKIHDLDDLMYLVDVLGAEIRAGRLPLFEVVRV